MANIWIGWKGKGKRRACMHSLDFTVPPFFDISVNLCQHIWIGWKAKERGVQVCTSQFSQVPPFLTFL